jgi:MFS transporter, DHA2 family, multidrug resistance protein
MTEAEVPKLSGLKLTLAGVALAMANFIVVLDLTIANVSVPHIAGGLAISPTQGTWTITSYAIAEAITVPLTGWLAARVGSVRLLLFCLLGFGVFSILCGISHTIEMLVVMRVLQGLSGGPLMPLTQTLLLHIYPKTKVSTAMGMWSLTVVVAPILGPILGGVLSDNYGWPWIFFMNVPIILGSFFLSARLLPKYETPVRRTSFDFVGLLSLIVWVGCFQMMLDVGREHDWFASPMVVILGVVAFIAFLFFVIWELFEDHPVVDIRLFRDRTLTLCAMATGLAFAAFFAALVSVPLWLQQVLNYTATEAGIVTASAGVAAVMVAPLATKLLDRVDLRLTISLGISAIGFAAMLRLDWSTEGGQWQFIAAQLLQGVGLTFFVIGLTTLSIARIAERDTASASGILSFIRAMSGAMATAVSLTMWDNSTRQSRNDIVSSLNDPASMIALGRETGLSHDQANAMLERLVETQAATVGVLDVYGFTMVMLFVAAASIWLIPKPPKGLKAGPTGH